MKHSVSSRLRTAFSWRENLRLLLVPRADAVPMATGLRALSMAWVLVQHVQQGLRPLLATPEGAALLTHPLLMLGWAGNLGVEIFFVLSGFLIGRILRSEREQTGRIDLRRFYVRRGLRILPVYLLAIGVNLALSVPNKEYAWANLLLVNNFVPFTKAFMAHTWSLAIEEQFYLVFPALALLLFRAPPARRLRVLGVVIVMAAVVALGLVLALGLELSLRAPSSAGFWRYMNAFYVKPYARFGSIALGVLVAELEAHETVKAWLERHRRTSALLALLAFAAMGAVIVVFPEARAADGSPRLFGAVQLALGGYVFAAAVGLLLLLGRTRHTVGRRLDRVLGARAFHPFAQLSYATFLLHPICITPLYGLVGFDLAHPFRSYLLLLVCAFAVSYALAIAVFLLVELPAMRMRPPPRHPARG